MLSEMMLLPRLTQPGVIAIVAFVIGVVIARLFAARRGSFRRKVFGSLQGKRHEDTDPRDISDEIEDQQAPSDGNHQHAATTEQLLNYLHQAERRILSKLEAIEENTQKAAERADAACLLLGGKDLGRLGGGRGHGDGAAKLTAAQVESETAQPQVPVADAYAGGIGGTPPASSLTETQIVQWFNELRRADGIPTHDDPIFRELNPVIWDGTNLRGSEQAKESCNLLALQSDPVLVVPGVPIAKDRNVLKSFTLPHPLNELFVWEGGDKVAVESAARLVNLDRHWTVTKGTITGTGL